MNYRFTPHEVDLQLLFSRPEQKGTSWEVAVRRRSAGHLFTRRINLLTSSEKAGNTKNLVEEMRDAGFGDVKLLGKLMLECNESVLASHRNGHPAVQLNGPMVRPSGPLWLCGGLLMKNKPNCWLGGASTGKSTLAAAAAVYYATGFRFCDREMEQGVAMYLDWEEDEETFRQIVYDVARNLGVTEWPPIIYVNMHGQRLRDRAELLTREVHDHHVGLLVLDAVAAMGAVPDEHVTYESIALEMSECLDSLPPVTVLALDHVTGDEFKDQRRPRLVGKPFVPNKARGSVRKVEFFRNQWTLMTDVRAEECGRHVVNWHHTKINRGVRLPSFATEILHYAEEISVMVRPMEVPEPEDEPDTKTRRLIVHLARTGGRTARELTLEIEGHEPSRSQVESTRKLLERAVEHEQLLKDDHKPPRYFCRQGDEQGVLIPFPGSSA